MPDGTLADRAARLLADAEAAESAMVAQSAAPRGTVRLAAPMSFGIREVAPILPDFLARYPEVSIDLHLSDAPVDVIGDGFDLVLRIGQLPDSSLLARRLAPVPVMIVASPAYLDRRGRPAHPAQLAGHDCFGYAYLRTRDAWHFSNAAGEEVTVRPSGQLRVNNGDAMLPAADRRAGGRGAAGVPGARGAGGRAAGTDPAGLVRVAVQPVPADAAGGTAAGAGAGAGGFPGGAVVSGGALGGRNEGSPRGAMRRERDRLVTASWGRVMADRLNALGRSLGRRASRG